jgi:predicted esterase
LLKAGMNPFISALLFCTFAGMQAHSIRVRRTARYYTLGNLSENTRTVWFVCHGYGQLAEFFVKKFAVLQDEHTFIIAPEALNRFYREGFSGRVGATWMTREDRLHDIDDYVDYLSQLYQTVLQGADPARLDIRILGFSQGAATVCRWVARGNVKTDQLILWAGVFPPDLPKDSWLTQLDQLPMTVVAGTQDPFMQGKGPEEYIWEFTRWGFTPDFIQFEGGHEIHPETLLQLKNRD